MSAPSLAPPTIDEYERVVLSSSPCAGLLSPQRALKKIAEIDQSGELHGEVLNTCYLAARQLTREDRFLKQRKDDISVAQEIESQKRAIEKLITFMKRYPGNASDAWGWALLEWKKRRDKNVVFPSINGTRCPLSQVFVDMLECYDSALENGMYSKKGKGAAWLYRFQAIALLYPDHKPLDTTTAPSHDLLIACCSTWSSSFGRAPRYSRLSVARATRCSRPASRIMTSLPP